MMSIIAAHDEQPQRKCIWFKRFHLWIRPYRVYTVTICLGGGGILKACEWKFSFSAFNKSNPFLMMNVWVMGFRRTVGWYITSNIRDLLFALQLPGEAKRRT